MLSIHSYQNQKQKLKVFITLLHYSQTSKQKSFNKSIASNFHKVSVWKQLFIQLKIYAMGMKCHRQCIKFIEKKRLLPKSLKALKQFSSLMKDKKRSKSTALIFLNQNRQLKAIQLFRQFKEVQNVQKQIKNKVKTFQESGLKKKYFRMWLQAQFLE